MVKVKVTRRTTKVLDNHPLADKLRERIKARDASYLLGVAKVEATYGNQKVVDYLHKHINRIKTDALHGRD